MLRRGKQLVNKALEINTEDNNENTAGKCFFYYI